MSTNRSSRARIAIDLARPCTDRWRTFDLRSTPDDDGDALAFLSLVSTWRAGAGDDARLPVFLHHQLFHQIAGFRFNLLQVCKLPLVLSLSPRFVCHIDEFSFDDAKREGC